MKTKKMTKILSVLLACILSISIILVCFNGNNTAMATNVRTVSISDTVDTQSVFSEFEDVNLTEDGDIITFSGKKTFTIDSFSDIDQISLEDDFEENFEYYIEYFEEVPPVVTYIMSLDTDAYSFELTLILEVDDEVIEDTVYGLVMESVDGEFDGLLCLEEETVLLSEICNYEVLDDVGLFSSIWNKIKSVASNIAKKIKQIFTQPLKILVVYFAPVIEILGGVISIRTIYVSAYKSAENYNNNINQTIDTNDGYIEEQKQFSSWQFGYKTMDSNGCGVVATYNTLRFTDIIVNDESDVDGELDDYRKNCLVSLIQSYELSGGALIYGYLGLNPAAIQPMLLAYGVGNVVTYSGTVTNQIIYEIECENLQENQMAIVCYWWRDKQTGTLRAHYASFNMVDGVYVVYNDSYLSDCFEYGLNIGDFFEENYSSSRDYGFIQGWIITK